MSKTIRVSEDTWNRLAALRDWQESLNQVVVRLLDMQKVLTQIGPILEGQKAYLEEKIAREKAAKAAHG